MIQGFANGKRGDGQDVLQKATVENMRENFVTFGLREVLDIPSNNNAPFRLLWELANEADGNNFSDYRKLKSFQK